MSSNRQVKGYTVYMGIDLAIYGRYVAFLHNPLSLTPEKKAILPFKFYMKEANKIGVGVVEFSKKIVNVYVPTQAYQTDVSKSIKTAELKKEAHNFRIKEGASGVGWKEEDEKFIFLYDAETSKIIIVFQGGRAYPVGKEWKRIPTDETFDVYLMTNQLSVTRTRHTLHQEIVFYGGARDFLPEKEPTPLGMALIFEQIAKVKGMRKRTPKEVYDMKFYLKQFLASTFDNLSPKQFSAFEEVVAAAFTQEKNKEKDEKQPDNLITDELNPTFSLLSYIKGDKLPLGSYRLELNVDLGDTNEKIHTVRYHDKALFFYTSDATLLRGATKVQRYLRQHLGLGKEALFVMYGTEN